MRKKIPTLLLMLVITLGYGQALYAQKAAVKTPNSVVYKTSFYFPKGQGRWTKDNDYPKMLQLLKWAKSDTTTLLSITGWADNSGGPSSNERISLFRARTVRNYLVEQGVAANRITFVGKGVDAKVKSPDKARRTDVIGIAVPVPAPPVVVPEAPKPQPKPKPVVDTVAKPQPPLPVEPEPMVEPIEAPILRYYVGVEMGMPFGTASFSSFAEAKTYGGFAAGLLVGYRLSPLLSAELGITFGRMRLGTNNCCSAYWMGADGGRYLSSVAGMESYSYKDIYSSVFMHRYALRLNIDVLQFINPGWDKRWSATVSPAIYGIGTKATIKESGNKHTFVKRNGQFQFGVGAALGGAYQINERLGVGVRSGLIRVCGKQFDGIRPSLHNNNMIWDNTIALTWRFNRE